MSDMNSQVIRVEVDEELKPVVPGFLESRKEDCARIVEMVETGSMSEIESLGHRLKGSGGSYGFDEISTIGEYIEQAARKLDAEGVLRSVETMRNYLARVEVTYV